MNFKKVRQKMCPLFFLFLISLHAEAQNITVNFKDLENTHDIALSPWGPFSKKYAGISHIPEMKKGIRFDVSIMPGYYRNKVLIPNVLFESGYFPWEVSTDMRQITYRYELEWKDRVFADVTYSVLDSTTVLVAINCVNNTQKQQNLALNTMAYLDYPEVYPFVDIDLPRNCKWLNGISYQELSFANPRPSDKLVYDGWMRGESRNNEYVGGSALAKNFGLDKNDLVTYSIPISGKQLSGKIGFRYRVKESQSVVFKATGLINQDIKFIGTGKFEMLTVPYNSYQAGILNLNLQSLGGADIELNGIYFGNDQDIESVKIIPVSKKFKPEIKTDPSSKKLILKYADSPVYYGLTFDYTPFITREFLNDELDIFFRRNVQEHVRSVLQGNNLGHFSNIFMRPVELASNSSKVIYGLISTGSLTSVEQKLGNFNQIKENFITKNSDSDSKILTEGTPYLFSNKMMRATVLSNIVYPIYTQQQYIRHFTPGKWWNSLYTWDSGFEAIGLSEINTNLAVQCINTYTTPAGSQSAFIHHGSPVPVQMLAFYDLWNKTQSAELLQYFYPRLKQYFEFLSGINKSSSTRSLTSNLLKTWDYFYNSGGWDDYPPQRAVHDKKMEPYVSPVITTAFCIRVAKMLRQTAEALNLKYDIKEYDKCIQLFTDAIQNNAWDASSGYFSYVVHNEKGEPRGFFIDSISGKNFNMGLDGAYPLFSGICTADQQEILLNKIFSSNHMWTPYGIGVVDQSAPYYRNDGYWNGSVWMPHQWFMWKTMLDLGRSDLAYKIAKTALDTWKNETDESYYTFEHFLSKTGRGAGWHQFAGLSTPVLSLFSAYFKQGTVTTGFETWIKKQKFSKEDSAYEAELSFDKTAKPHKRSILVCLNPSYSYDVYFNGKKLQDVTCPYKGLLNINLPATNTNGSLQVKRL